MRLVIAATLLLSSFLPAPALAEECNKGWVAELDVPRDGSTVRPGARFRVLDYWGCSAVTGGPRHEYRLMTGEGAEIPFKAIPWAEYFIELAPVTQVTSGEIQLELRRPVDKDTLGPWEKLARVKVAGTADTAAPEVDGILRAETVALEGTVMLSPCQGVPGWQLETRLHFWPARDAGSLRDELLYLLERAPAGEGPWQRVTTLRPTPEGDMMMFSWKEESGWGEAWTYRISARDMAGNEARGARTMLVKNPSRPSRELWTPGKDGLSGSPEASGVTPTSQSRCVCGAAPGSAGGAAGTGLFWAGAAVLVVARRRGARREQDVRDPRRFCARSLPRTTSPRRIPDNPPRHGSCCPRAGGPSCRPS